jgi:hypothetical protein
MLPTAAAAARDAVRSSSAPTARVRRRDRRLTQVIAAGAGSAPRLARDESLHAGDGSRSVRSASRFTRCRPRRVRSESRFPGCEPRPILFDSSYRQNRRSCAGPVSAKTDAGGHESR